MPVQTLLPVSGTGFVTCNRGESTHFGEASTIATIEAVGAAWNALHPDFPFSVGHISRKGGGQFDPHDSHKRGIDIDVRPMRKDGQNLEVTISQSQYDREKTTQLIDLWWQLGPIQLIYFNDQTVIAAGLSRFFENHHHHFHVRVRLPGQTLKIRDRGSDVAEVQRKLGIEADGRFGPATQQAVEDFQEAHGLVGDGVVGPKTFAALGL